MKVRSWMMVGSVVVLGLGMWATNSSAADDEKEAREVVLKMAAALKEGKDADAKKLAEKLKGADLEDIMNLMLPRKAGGKGGIGIGSKPGAITPDGIERKLQAVEKAAPPAAEMADLEQAGYIMKAISLAIPNKIPKGKNPKAWPKFNETYEKTAQEFIDAAKAKDAKKVQAAAKNLNNACIACHNDYK